MMDLMRFRILPLLGAVAALAQTPPPQVAGGNITVYAGNGTAGFSGDGGPAAQAQLNFPFGPRNEEFGHIVLDAQGNLYIADKGNHRIRRVAANGTISTIAGTGTSGFSGDGGPAVRAQLSFPCGLALDRQGNIYITDQANNRVRRIDAQGIITTVAGDGQGRFGGDGGPADRASLWEPSAVAVDAAGNLYIADYINDRVRLVNAQTRVITTIAGNGQHGDDDPGQDNVPATSIKLGFPAGLLLDGAGNLFIADHHNNVVRVVNLQSGQIRRVAGSGRHAAGVAAGDGGPALQADLDWPVGLALDAAGSLYIADFHDNVIRRVTTPLAAGAVITTVVGVVGTRGYLGDNGPASDAFLDFPAGLAIDAGGNLYVADWHNQRVRRVAPGVPSPARPTLHAVVNGASFAPPPARVAPGSIVSLFGARLANTTDTAKAAPLPTALGGTTVSITAGGTTWQMPLLYVSPTQINAQLPFEAPHGGPAGVVVRAAGGASEPLTINISLSETGIFQYGGERAVAVNSHDGQLNSPANPAPRGTFLTVYLTGQGGLNPPLPSGEAAPLDRLSTSIYEATATIGDAPAIVHFLGATPGFVGLSQANILIPENAPTGDQHLVITVAGHPSNRPLVHIR
jgi:uncharacterized protein (TIGR03437 family)